MYGDRRCPEFINGMHNFLRVAESNNQNGFMICPCDDCRNKRNYPCSRTLHFHLLREGFMPNYFCWTKHGEIWVIMEDNEEEDDDNYHVFSEHGGTTMEEDEPEHEIIVDDQSETVDRAAGRGTGLRPTGRAGSGPPSSQGCHVRSEERRVGKEC